MGSIEDNQWVDMIIDKIGVALSKVDESIQKSIEFWTELTKDIYDEQPTHDTTGQPNNGESGQEDSYQNTTVAEVNETPIQHWAMYAKEIPSQHWAMRVSKIPKSLMEEQRDDNDCDDYNEEKEKEKEKEKEEDDEGTDEGTVSESSDEDMWELNLKTSNCYHHDYEEANRSRLKREDAYEQLKNVDMPSEEEDESWDDDYDEEKEEEVDETAVSKSYESMKGSLRFCYLPPHLLHKQNSALYMMRGNPYQLSKNDDTSSKNVDEEQEEETTVSESCVKMSEINLETSATSYIPSHNRNEEDTGSSLRGGYELLKNDDTSSEEEEEEDDSWDNEEEVMEWVPKHENMSDISYESLVGHYDEDEDKHEDEDEVSDKLQGFVDVKEEEIANKSEFSEVETLSPECDWVYVTRN